MNVTRFRVVLTNNTESYHLIAPETDILAVIRQELHDLNLLADGVSIRQVMVVPLCDGCARREPNQMAHMEEPYGCLSSQ